MPGASSPDVVVYPSLYYDDAHAALDFLERAFGFKRRLVVPGPAGQVVHAELTLGTGIVMLGSARKDLGCLSPRSLGGSSGGLSVRVDDPDAHCARARAAGAVIEREPRDEEYGARGYMARDPEGHAWWFGTYRPGAYWDAG
jgi:uncharacterized glyoxalase superfamily protein PhnB